MPELICRRRLHLEHFVPLRHTFIEACIFCISASGVLLLPFPIIPASGQFVAPNAQSHTQPVACVLSNMCECVNSFIFTYADRFPIVSFVLQPAISLLFFPLFTFAVRRVCLSS